MTMTSPNTSADAPRKRRSALNSLRAAVFGATFLLWCGFVVGGSLIGNAVAFGIPYLVAAIALSYYIIRDVFGIGPVDAVFASDDIIRSKRAARRSIASE